MANSRERRGRGQLRGGGGGGRGMSGYRGRLCCALRPVPLVPEGPRPHSKHQALSTMGLPELKLPTPPHPTPSKGLRTRKISPSHLLLSTDAHFCLWPYLLPSPPPRFPFRSASCLLSQTHPQHSLTRAFGTQEEGQSSSPRLQASHRRSAAQRSMSHCCLVCTLTC